MEYKDFFGPVEELISEYYEKKQEFVSKNSGLITDSDRYYYLDGIEEGLRISWKIFNDLTKINKLRYKSFD